MSLKLKTISAAYWQIINVILFSVMNIGYLMIMTRLVEKSYHGRFVIIQLLVLILSMLSKGGFYVALVRREENTPKQISLSFWGSIISGGIFSITIFLLSDTITNLYSAQFPKGLVKVMSVFFLFLSFGLTSFGLLIRDMNFKKLLYAQCGSFFLGNIVFGVLMAYHGFNLWAFVYGYLIYTFLNSIFYYLLKPHSLKFNFGRTEIKEVFHFSLGFTMTEMLNTSAVYVDKLIIGGFTPMSTLAIFEKGQQTTRLPVRIFGNAFDNIFYSLFSKIKDEREKSRQFFLRISTFLWMFIAYITTFLFCFSKHIIVILLGAKWMDSIIYFKIFALVMPLQLISKVGDTLLRSKDKLYLASRIKMFYLSMIILVSFTIVIYPLHYVSVLLGITYFLYVFVMLYFSNKLLEISTKEYFKVFLRPTGLFIFLFFFNSFIIYIFSDYLGRLVMMLLACFFHLLLLTLITKYAPSLVGKTNIKIIKNLIESNQKIKRILPEFCRKFMGLS